ncbi:MAG: hypothetical protein DRJ69_05375 [Thermoprotei archaeon]|nr:MAG: hypothetical protein DRJ69_05375 [Thermoprotei archaeon]
MNEIAHKVGDALTALTLLKFSKIQRLTVSEDEEELRRRALAVKPVLQDLLRDIENTIKSGYGPSPLLRALQEEYGYADIRRVREKLRKALNALERIEERSYKEEDFEELEKLLECIAYEASSRSQELVARAGRY